MMDYPACPGSMLTTVKALGEGGKLNNVWIALALTTFAGMATGIGSAIAFFAKRTNYRFLSVATGFSAGVMLYVSFVEIFVKGVDALTEEYGDFSGYALNTSPSSAGWRSSS